MCSAFKVLLIHKTNAYQGLERRVREREGGREGKWESKRERESNKSERERKKEVVSHSNYIKHIFIFIIITIILCQMNNSVKPCFVYSLPWISWLWGAEKNYDKYKLFFHNIFLFMCELCCAAESWLQRLNEISVPLEAGTVHVLLCFLRVKASFEVRSSRVLQPYCCKSLMCLSSLLLIRLIKNSLIHLHPQLNPAYPRILPPKHQI